MRSFFKTAWAALREDNPARNIEWLGVILTGFGPAALVWVAVQVQSHSGLASLDARVWQWLVEHRNGTVTSIMATVSAVFSPTGVLVLAVMIAAVWALSSRSARRPILLVGGVVLGEVLAAILKAITERSRPPVEAMALKAEHSFSFPSEHVVATSLLVFLLMYLVLSRTPSSRLFWAFGFGAILLIALVAFSRLYLGYHWLTDVCAGFTVAISALGLVILADCLWSKWFEPLD